MSSNSEWDSLAQSLGDTFAAMATEPNAGVEEFERVQQIQPKINHTRLQKNIDVVRGELDHFALKQRYHDPFLHQRLSPASAEAAIAFQSLERGRYESCGLKRYRGAAHNIDAMDRKLHQQFSLETQTGEPNQAHLPEALRLILREKMTGLSPPTQAEAFVEPWRKAVSQAFTHMEHAGTIPETQQEFADWAQVLLAQLNKLAGRPEQPPSDDAASEEAENNPDTDQGEQPSDNEPQAMPEPAQMLPMDSSGEGQEQEAREGEMETAQEGTLEAEPQAYIPPDIAGFDSGHYHIFTQEYDEIIEANALATAIELQALRTELDEKSRQQQDVISRLANRLQRRLMAQQNRFWQFDQEHGVLDSARLARVVIDPQQPLLFKREKTIPFRDTVVSLLIDNSGSMRGRPIAIAAISADILARTLERCGVATEILGFTTKEWRGGKCKTDWTAMGKPRQPGRLNELRHIIYKKAEQPYRRIRDHLGLMLKEGVLKENIDGEALIWAYQRLIARPEERRIMMVISDGAPVDDSTLSANGAHILEAHLRHVIAQIESRDKIQLLAIGIGHDVTRYYRRSVMIRHVDELGSVLLSKIENLLLDR